MSWVVDDKGCAHVTRDVDYYQLRIEPPDIHGDAGFVVEFESCGCCSDEAWIYLGVDDRRKLIEWLQACTPE